MVTLAEKCRDTDDPLDMAIRHCAYTGKPNPFVKRYYFSDRSWLDFKITYSDPVAGTSDEH